MATFSDEDDEIMVEMINQNPSLYDLRLKTYRDIIIRDNIWAEIAKKINKTSDDCRKRWKCIRDSYLRIKRKKKLPTGSAAGSKAKKWPLHERLFFLDNIPTERKTICNIETANDKNVIISSENGELNDDETDLEKDAEPNEKEINSEGTSEKIKDNAPAPTGGTKVNFEEKTDTEIKKKKAIISNINKCIKRAKSENSTLQAALFAYWRERDNERRAEIEILKSQSLNKEQSAGDDEDGIKSFSSHVGKTLSKLSPALRVEAQTKVFNLLADFELRSLNQRSSNSSSTSLAPNSQFSPTSNVSFVQDGNNILFDSSSYSAGPDDEEII